MLVAGYCLNIIFVSVVLLVFILMNRAALLLFPSLHQDSTMDFQAPEGAGEGKLPAGVLHIPVKVHYAASSIEHFNISWLILGFLWQSSQR